VSKAFFSGPESVRMELMGDLLGQKMRSSAMNIEICAFIDISFSSPSLDFPKLLSLSIRGTKVCPI
jgi:hypothetical protein